MGITIVLLALIVLSAIYINRHNKKIRKANKEMIGSAHQRTTSSHNARISQHNNGWRYKGTIDTIQYAVLPDGEPLSVPSGTLTVKIYTYDGRPLKGIRKGTRFTIEVVPGTRTMVSVYTGRVWTSEGAVAYKGMLFGFITNGQVAKEVLQLMAIYPYVVLQAERLGTDKGGWPIIEATLPSKKWIQSAMSGIEGRE